MNRNTFDEIKKEIELEELRMHQDDHYSKYKVQPFDVFKSLGIFEAYCQAAAIKYIIRYKDKGGVDDLKKAASMCNVLAAWLGERCKT